MQFYAIKLKQRKAKLRENVERLVWAIGFKLESSNEAAILCNKINAKNGRNEKKQPGFEKMLMDSIFCFLFSDG